MNESSKLYQNKYENCLKIYNREIVTSENVFEIVKFEFDEARNNLNHSEIMGLVLKQFLMELVFNSRSLDYNSVVASYDENHVETQSSSSIDFKTIFNLLEISLECAAQNHFDSNVTLCAIEDLFDVLIIPDVEILFTYLESRVSKYTVGLEPNKGKGLTLLRLCNELSRRLSKIKNTKTCGRILILLSSIFPLCDRSGVNQKGDFHVENATIFNSGEQSISRGNDDGTAMDVDGEEKKVETEKDILYNSFWRLQEYFSNPVLIFEQTKYQAMKKDMDLVLEKFESIQAASPRKGTQKKLYKGVIKKPERDISHYFFPKYLTSRNLFDLELNDPLFRRQFLFQFLILAYFVSQISSDEYKKICTSKSVQFAFKLNADQAQWFHSSKQRAKGLVEKIVNNKLFFKIMQTVLAHEKNWTTWKALGCKTYVRDALVVEKDNRKKMRMDGSLASDSSFLGNQDLTLLWANASKLPQALVSNKDRSAKTVKSLDAFLEPLDLQVAEDLETPLDGLEPEYLLYNQMHYNWLGYRVAVREGLSLFSLPDNDKEHINILDKHKPGKSLLRAWRASRKGL